MRPSASLSRLRTCYRECLFISSIVISIAMRSLEMFDSNTSVVDDVIECRWSEDGLCVLCGGGATLTQPGMVANGGILLAVFSGS